MVPNRTAARVISVTAAKWSASGRLLLLPTGPPAAEAPREAARLGPPGTRATSLPVTPELRRSRLLLSTQATLLGPRTGLLRLNPNTKLSPILLLQKLQNQRAVAGTPLRQQRVPPVPSRSC